MKIHSPDTEGIGNPKRTSIPFSIVVPLLLVLMSCAGTGRINEIIARHRGEKITEYEAFRDPDYPPDKRIEMLPEWTPVSHLVVSDRGVSSILPNDDPENRFYIDFILRASEYVDILIIVSEESGFERILSLLREYGRLSLIDQGRIKFLVAFHNSKWIRDYGPFFGTDRSGMLYCFDTMYNNIRIGESFEPRPDDEIMPQFLLGFMSDRRRGIRSIRIPYVLNGGDFFTDGEGICYISKETVLSNGGDFNDAALILRHYFGAQKCVFMETLPPHIIIPHIDMFFKLVTGNICLLGRYEDSNPDPVLEVIQKWCNESLEKNYAILRASNPDMRVYRVPMPNIEKRSGHPIDGYYAKIIDIINRNLSLEAGSEDSTLWDTGLCPEEAAEVLLEDFEKIKEMSLRNRLLGIPESHYVTRTYLNSLFINGNRKAVLLPVYEDHEGLNARVRTIYEEVYTEAYGTVDIIPVYADLLIPFDGAIHCITATLPADTAKERR
ncbi:MAG: agmatine deiminase family protein [bacterium]